MEKLKRFHGSELELRDNESGLPDISGIGSPFYNADIAGTTYELFDGVAERIMPGAYDDLSEDPGAAEIYSTFNHNDMQPLGRVSAGTLDLMVDEVGLRYQVKASRTSYYKDLVESMRRGDVHGSSITFVPLKQRWIEGDDDGPDVREITLLRLYEVGPVVNPAYTATTSMVRSADAIEAEKSHQQWRQELTQQRLAKAMAGSGKMIEGIWRRGQINRLA